jgi:hypothetical protein
VKLLIATVVLISFGSESAWSDINDPDSYPKYQAALSLSENIKVFQAARMPLIGICSRILSPMMQKHNWHITTAEQSELRKLLDPREVRGATCIAEILERVPLHKDAALVPRLLALLPALAQESRSNPTSARFRYGFRSFAAKGFSVCRVLITQSKQYEFFACLRKIEFFDDQRDRLPLQAERL